ncbi:MAG: hypothetical protein ACREB0_09960, partial [Sphingopyxis sp.]
MGEMIVVGDRSLNNAPRVLWLCTHLEVPPRAGGSLYAIELAQALARHGADVTVFGVGRVDARSVGDVRLAVQPSAQRRGHLRHLMSSYPIMTARLELPELRSRLETVLAEPWDVVVVNHLMSVWALPQLLT